MDLLEMTNNDQDHYYKSTLNLVNLFVKSNQRKRINLLSDIESEVENLYVIGNKILDNFDHKGDAVSYTHLTLPTILRV